ASLLLEGGAAVHAAAWDEDVVDFVRLYVTPHLLRSGVPLLPDRDFSSASLVDRRVTVLGPDVLIEGYVHGPRLSRRRDSQSNRHRRRLSPAHRMPAGDRAVARRQSGGQRRLPHRDRGNGG